MVVPGSVLPELSTHLALTTKLDVPPEFNAEATKVYLTVNEVTLAKWKSTSLFTGSYAGGNPMTFIDCKVHPDGISAG